MKSFIRGILTIWIVILLIIFGLVSSMKAILIDTTDEMIKKELKTNIVKVIDGYSPEKIPDDIIKKVEKEIDRNPNIKKVVNNYYDKILDVLSSKEENITIDVAKELETLIDNGEEVLKDYGVTLTPNEKKKLLSVVSSNEINDMVNDTITEIKRDMGNDMKRIIDTYTFLTSMAFKTILVGLIAVALLFIALLKKNLYGWLSNFGIASAITGILVGVVLPIIVTQVLTDLINESGITISTGFLNTYGYTLIALGIVSIVAGRIIATKNKKTTEI